MQRQARARLWRLNRTVRILGDFGLCELRASARAGRWLSAHSSPLPSAFALGGNGRLVAAEPRQDPIIGRELEFRDEVAKSERHQAPSVEGLVQLSIAHRLAARLTHDTCLLLLR